jgi:C4-dicarboxylate-specific signal transduction histidine kinase
VESRELAFFGKIAAGVTHELKNVLAIINESNGLMSDLIAMSKNMPFPHLDRFQRSITKIEQQVRRGVDLTGKFNRFSHSMDNPVVSVDLNEIVELTVALAQRFARLKRVELIHSVCSKPVMVLTNPFRLQMALTKAIDSCIATMSGTGIVVFQVIEDAEHPSLSIRCESAPESTVELKEALAGFRAWEEFKELASMLGAVVEWKESVSSGFSVVIDREREPLLSA